ncbi:MAG: radical SAM protein [Candidatus Thorarchaeota archaeon]|nr:radical SAM protein [Candidatus Thorarchaeota archaeon]
MTFDILSDGMHLLEIPATELDEFLRKGFSVRKHNFGRNFYCYGPTSYPHNIPSHKQSNTENFISLSVTGTSCSLMCEHCKSRLLVGMESTTSPEQMIRRLERAKAAGGDGVLISGGSDAAGHVPLLRFGEAIKYAKQKLGLEVVVHTGLVRQETAEMLAQAEVDAAMLDVIGDEVVSREIYHIEDGPHKMRVSLSLLKESGVPIVPHIMVGLYYGQVRGEIEALQMVSEFSPEAVVIIALSPLRHTPMENLPPPSPESIGRVLLAARLGLPDIPLLLGCARPLGQHKIDTDLYAVRAGVNGIAYISEQGVQEAKHHDLNPAFLDVCCSLAYRHVREQM